MGNVPFSQKFSGALLISVIGSLLAAWILTRSNDLKVPVTNRERYRQPKSEQGEPAAAASPTTLSLVEIHSEPEGAQIYVNWQPKGSTPASFSRNELKGLLVVFKKGHEAAYQDPIEIRDSHLSFALLPEITRSPLRVIFSSDASPESLAGLKSKLIEGGFSVLGSEETHDLQAQISRAGGLSNPALRAWARSKYDVDYVLSVQIAESITEPSQQDLGYNNVKEPARGLYHAGVTIQVEVIDLRSGDQIAAASGRASEFALDRPQALQKALEAASRESVASLKENLR